MNMILHHLKFEIMSRTWTPCVYPSTRRSGSELPLASKEFSVYNDGSLMSACSNLMSCNIRNNVQALHWFFTASYLANKAIKRVYIYDYSRSWTPWPMKIIIISYLAHVTWHFGSALGWLNACTSLMNPADFDICNQNQRRWHLKTDYEK